MCGLEVVGIQPNVPEAENRYSVLLNLVSLHEIVLEAGPALFRGVKVIVADGAIVVQSILCDIGFLIVKTTRICYN